MRILRYTNEMGRDFYAIYVCEHCGAEKSMSGYHDKHFHTEVIPGMKCEKCGKNRSGADG